MGLQALVKRKKHEPDAGKVKYQPTEREKSALAKLVSRRAAETAPRLNVPKGGEAAEILLDHPDKKFGYALLLEALGTADLDFIDGLLYQLINASSQGDQIDERELNFMLSIIKGVKPKDQLETMLAIQMAAVHMATMTFARRLTRVENIPQQDSAERAFNKLARTYATQMETLKRYRTGGEQKVTVQHVSVSEGGQAIVGNFTQAAEEAAPKKAANIAPALTDARTSAMTIIGNQERAPVALRRRQKGDGRSSA